jgi:uncharacterized linocin/CFP29 family protein
MNHLLRDVAPITESGWGLLDDEARERLTVPLAARKLVDFAGPRGWGHSATSLGRVEPLAGAGEGVTARRRLVLPLVELRAEFSISRAELEAAGRGAEDVDLEALDGAARAIAVAENVAVFHGWEQAGIAGVAESSPHAAIHLGGDFDNYPRCVAQAVERLTDVGVDGPYGLALSSEDYTGVIETTEHGGYPVFDHLGQILGGPIVRAPGLRGGVVLSQRGGDFLFESGQDLSIGYLSHDAHMVTLYLEESFSFRIATPEAAVSLGA